MILLKKKLVRIGSSKGIIVPKEFIELQQSDDKYFVVYVLTKKERGDIRA